MSALTIPNADLRCLVCGDTVAMTSDRWRRFLKGLTGCYCDRHNPKRQTIEQRFWAKVDKTPGLGPWGDCWLWTGALCNGEYGAIKLKGVMVPAHIMSWFLTTGQWPRKLKVCHRCDIRNCVRYEHLFKGTQKDNIRDMINKNRHKRGAARGESHPMSKLTETIVRDMRAEAEQGKSIAAIARKHQIGYSVARGVINRTRWRHV